MLLHLKGDAARAVTPISGAGGAVWGAAWALHC